ncbi:MAG: RIP metalloprotease RseP [Candidatus Latescibacteria bacterium]|nr:RIP metalloprotease RseP [Candidatus Latescibacterota bacterium]
MLVYVHELGHYWVAVRAGVRIEVFSIGFGPELFGWYNKAGTRWKISAIPLGGYVKMFGQSDTEADGKEEENTPLTDEEKSVSFAHKTLGQRTAIVAAGPIANFIFAAVVFFLLAWIVGSPVPHAGIGTVMPDSAAEEAGILQGDRIIEINGKEIRLFSDLQEVIRNSPAVNLGVIVLRENAEIALTVTPRLITSASGETYGQLGVTPDPEQVDYESVGFFKAAWFGVERTTSMVSGILSYLGEMFSGDRGTEDLGGPLRIAQISGDMAEGGIINLIVFMAALSVNLGLINLFPIPMLDGGHLVFYAAELIRGKPLNEKAQEYGFGFGLILLIMIFVFVTWNDLEHFQVIQFFRDLIS